MSETEKVRIGHSPDSDDAFMFYALAKGLIPTGDFEIVHVIEDIETLNQRALKAELEGYCDFRSCIFLCRARLRTDAVRSKHRR